ncbi:MAG: carboxypeptidase-like regulatory domain-containing protein, partial [Bacteroidia bacterium]|nr:carboxypeptidase-like regulatory domain-containing protein [Bacteroidia bacterium]
MKQFFLVAGILFSALSTFAQTQQRKVIQFSGVIVSGDSLKPVPYVNVMVKNTYRGTISDYYGFFSFVSHVNDTIEFSAIGYRDTRYIIPGDLKENRYSIIQMLQKDTILLKETVIYPWPTREQFDRAFIELKIPDDHLATAQKNLSREKLFEAALNMQMDPSMNQDYTSQQFNTRLYNAGQIPMNNLLNPIAWARFVQS